MEKIISIFILGVLLCSGFGVAVSSTTSNEQSNQLSLAVTFSSPVLIQNGDFFSLVLDHSNAWFNKQGHPLLPAYQKTYTLPFGTKIKDIQVTFSEPREQVLSKPIHPGSIRVALTDQTNQISDDTMDTSIYTSNSTYPEEIYSYTLGAGLDGLTHVFYLTVTCYPIHYTPASKTIIWSDHVDINIITEKPQQPFIQSEAYDFLIIAPAQFSDALQPLITHKNTMGMKTILTTVEDIIDQYTGRDSPEKIKYCIKDMFEKYGIHYVLLVGGLNSFIYATARDDANQGTTDYYVPVRYTNVYDGGSVQDTGYISDLYYADIYNGTGGFSSWDSNNNSVFAEWKGTKGDIIDLYPDVYVGRLACVNKREVTTMVNKIINYEKTAADPAWFKKIIVIGSDTFNDSGTHYREGEVENQKVLNYMTGFDPIKIWGSNRNSSGLVPIPRDIVKTISQGAGFVAFSGHGSPERWNTYWPGAFNVERARGLWYFNIPLINNKEKLPVIVIGGCHNSQFNVTATGFLTGTPWIYSPVPECFSWLFDRNTHGGSIATMGNTGLGFGAVGENGDLDGDGVNDPDCVEALGGYLESQFFKAYGVNHTDNLGATWGTAIISYLKVYPGMSDKTDCKTVQEWVLLGDPSLKIGGYSS